MDASLSIYSGDEVVTRETLKALPTPQGTNSWRPVGFYDLVTAIDRQLAVRDIRITKEEYALARENLRLFGVLELAVPGANGFSGTDYTFAMGVRTSNDRSFSTSLIAGAKIFVCSNLAFSGEFVAMARKHTKAFDLNADVSRAIDRFQAHISTFGGKLDELREHTLDDVHAKAMLVDAKRGGYLPDRLFDQVLDTYLDPTPDMTDVAHRSQWGLFNAMTRAVNKLEPASRFQVTTQLGKFFELAPV